MTAAPMIANAKLNMDQRLAKPGIEPDHRAIPDQVAKAIGEVIQHRHRPKEEQDLPGQTKGDVISTKA